MKKIYNPVTGTYYKVHERRKKHEKLDGFWRDKNGRLKRKWRDKYG